MAEGSKALAEEPEPRDTNTKRVVLRRERVLVLPEGVSLGDIDPKDAEVIRRAFGIKGGRLNSKAHVEAWVVVGEFEGASKQRAIEAHAGKPNTPEAKPGTYKAPTTTAWAGGREYVKPAEPKVEAKDIE